MANERDERHAGLEEEEYHFSDDQINYEVEPTAEATKPPVSGKKLLLDKFNQYRKWIAGSIIFIVLIAGVYKMLMPTSAPPSTEFSQNAASSNNKAVAKSTVPSTVTPSQMVGTPPNGGAVLAQQLPAPGPSGVAPPQLTANPQVAPTATMPVTVPEPNQVKNMMDRFAALEQQNSAIMNLLQTVYAQKMADYETQNNVTQEKIAELTKRVTNIEASLNQLAQLLQGEVNKAVAATASTSGEGSVAKPTEFNPKITYTVQAIIPGRAWLKSDAGDTVTVAEGDILKDYGRVAKINPYDGVVEIDTGSKVLTLSYGASGG